MNRRFFLGFGLVALPMFLGSCAAGGAGASSNRDPDLLTLEDLAPHAAMDTYSVIRRLKGSWLRTRSTGTMTNTSTGQLNSNLGSNDESQIKIYIDGSLRVAGVEDLKDLPVAEVMEIRHLNARDATMQYGTDHGAGAILVTTGR